MGVVSSHTDPERRTLTLTTELAAAPDRVWALWADARRFERWWGPPGLPLIVEEHDLSAGGESRFHVDLPAGTRIPGRLTFQEVHAPELIRGHFHGDGLDPIALDVGIASSGPDQSRMTIVATFVSSSAMTGAFEIGVDHGMAAAISHAEDALVPLG
jgi:uncharacterized protein YndB with AHSA1/START domain